MAWPMGDSGQERLARNVGKCTMMACTSTIGARCDAFCCEYCCRVRHEYWPSHIRADGSITTNAGRADSRLPARYGGEDQKTEPEYDYDKPPEFGDAKELGDDYVRCFVPFYNYKANTVWPVDYIG